MRHYTEESRRRLSEGAKNNKNRHRFTREEARAAGRKSAMVRAMKNRMEDVKC